MEQRTDKDEVEEVKAGRRKQSSHENSAKHSKKMKGKKMKGRWSNNRYDNGVANILAILQARRASAENPLMRKELEKAATPLIGDTGLCQHLLGCIQGMELKKSKERVCRQYNADGHLVYWLERAELKEIRKLAGVSNPYWVPPLGWRLGDPVRLEEWAAKLLNMVDEAVQELDIAKSQLQEAIRVIGAKEDAETSCQAIKLLRMAIYNITYIRGLFHEKHFSDKSVPALEMEIKKLMPMDAESRRLIDWMEKGVRDSLQKKYLKTLLFCICEKDEGLMIEEYAFSFSYPNTGTEEVKMNMSRTGSKKGSTTFTSNASEVTPDEMRSSACKMIRTLVSLMRTLDPMPERTILMKLMYYDDVTPEDYEPPFFKCCADNEAINIWNKNPLKMEVGNVNSKHLVLSLKVKSVLDPCDDNNVNSGDDGMRVYNESDQDGDFSDTEARPSEAERYIVAPNDGKCKGLSTGTISEDDTQDAAHEEELAAQVKEWIRSREIGTVNVSDVLSNFPDISMEMAEGVMERLLKDGVLSRASKDGYTVNQTVDPHIKEVIMQNVQTTEGTKQNNGDLIYMKALYHALPMDYVTIAKLQGKLDGEANHTTVRKLIDKMVQDGYVKNSANRRLGKAVIHSESSNRKLLEIKTILEGNEGEQMAIETNAEHADSERKDLLKVREMRDGSTMGCLHSIGSDLTCTRELPELQQNVSMQSGQEAASAMNKDPSRTPTSVREPAVPVCSLESGVLGQKIKRSLTGGSEMQSTQDKRSRKASMVKEPILQHVKRQKPQAQ